MKKIIILTTLILSLCSLTIYAYWNDGYTVSYLPFNGANNSTTMTDVIGKTWTAYGTAKISTDNYMYGGSSLFLNGSTHYISTVDSDDFNFGNQDFTVETWIKKTEDGTYMDIAGQLDATGTFGSRGFQLETNPANKIFIALGLPTTYEQLTSVQTVTIASGWTHLVIQRHTNTLRLYINGNLDVSKDIGTMTINNSNSKFAIGRAGDYTGSWFKGYIDDFIIQKGIAVYTTNFAPSIITASPSPTATPTPTPTPTVTSTPSPTPTPTLTPTPIAPTATPQINVTYDELNENLNIFKMSIMALILLGLGMYLIRFF